MHDVTLGKTPNPRGYSNQFLTGCAAKGLTPLAISKDFSPSKNGRFDCFLEICKNCDSFLRGFHLKNSWFWKFFAIFIKWDPLLRNFWQKWDPNLRIFCEKLTHLGGTSPYSLTCEYPTDPNPEVKPHIVKLVKLGKAILTRGSIVQRFMGLPRTRKGHGLSPSRGTCWDLVSGPFSQFWI